MEKIYIEKNEDGEVYCGYATMELAIASLLKRGYKQLDGTEFSRLSPHVTRLGKPIYEFRHLVELDVVV